MRFTRKLISKRSTTNDHSNKSWRWFYVIGYIIYQAYTTYNNLYKHTTHKFRNAWLLHHQAYQTQFPPNVYFASHQIPGEWLHQIDTKFVAQIKLGWHQFTNSPIHRLIALIPIDCQPFAPGASHTSGTEMRKYIRIMLSRQRQITEVSS